MDERRRSPRYAVHDVRGQLLWRLGAKLIALESGSALLELTEPIPAGAAYVLTLRRPGSVTRLAGRVVECRPAGERLDETGEAMPAFETRLAFDAGLGGRLLEELRGGDSAVSVVRRMAARIRLRAPVPVDLTSAQEFEVRRISRTGLLIETRLAAALGSEIALEVTLEGKLLSCRGRVAYVIESGPARSRRPSRFEVGVEFVTMSDEDRRVLEEFVDHLAG